MRFGSSFSTMGKQVPTRTPLKLPSGGFKEKGAMGTLTLIDFHLNDPSELSHMALW